MDTWYNVLLFLRFDFHTGPGWDVCFVILPPDIRFVSGKPDAESYEGKDFLLNTFIL
jgi:hypothetical protein